MQFGRRMYVGKPRRQSVADSLARHIRTAQVCLSKPGLSERARAKWRRQIVRMRELRDSLQSDESLVR
jgi:hypothetical protein